MPAQVAEAARRHLLRGPACPAASTPRALTSSFARKHRPEDRGDRTRLAGQAYRATRGSSSEGSQPVSRSRRSTEKTLRRLYRQYNKKTGFELTPEDYFDSLSVSERTTFDAVTHALMKTQLTDESGASLGGALDLVDGIVRISGHQYGRQGDEQFRVYVRLREGARETLERSREFSRGRENTVIT